MLAYPNPTKGAFKLAVLDFASQCFQVQVLNSKGQVVEQRRINAREAGLLDFDLTCKAKGLYLIRVVSDKSVQVQKVLVQ